MLAGVSPVGSTLTITSRGRAAGATWRIAEASILPSIGQASLQSESMNVSTTVPERNDERATRRPSWSRKANEGACRAPGFQVAWPCSSGTARGLATAAPPERRACNSRPSSTPTIAAQPTLAAYQRRPN